jgi:hypothetical protein
MKYAGLLAGSRVAAFDVRQSEVMIGIAIGEERRPVVRLPIHFLESNHLVVEDGRPRIVEDKQIDMPEATRPVQGMLL